MKKVISILICLCLVISTFVFANVSASAETYSGSCGDNVTWSLNTSTGVLTISGTGAMTNYTSSSEVPWNSYKSYIKSVTIGSGVTTIGHSAFYYCTSLTSITIPDSVTSIGKSAFYDTGYYNNTDNWENNVLYIGNYLIDAKSSISGDYEIKEGTKLIAAGAFFGCDSLTSVTIPDSVTSIGYEAFGYCYDDEGNFVKIDGFTIYGYAGSAAETYAEDNDITFVDLEQHTHSYLSTITIQPTCTGTGVRTYTCGCSDSYTEIIPATGKHSYTSKVTKQPTCTETGVLTYICECQDSYTEVIPATGEHTYTSKATKQPTCTKTGVRTYTCSCGDSYTKAIAKKSHSYKWVTTKKASYVATGKKAYKCSSCGKVAKTKTIAKLKLKTPVNKYTGAKKKLKVTYKKVTGATGFQVRYKASNGKWKTKTYNTKKSVTKAISLKKGKYKVQIRAFVKQSGKKAYSSWSKAKTVKVK